MTSVQIIDTFPAFLTYWSQVKDKSLDDQLESWATEYMSSWPDLLAKQLDDYSLQKQDWRQIGRKKIFLYLPNRLPAMELAHQNLLELCEPVYLKVQQAFSFESDITFVIYIGIGCGAGWATTFRDVPAVLFGLENIAECGWSEAKAITGLVAHELGHLVHFYWRAERGKLIGAGPWWQLYEEGFAQRCESSILGSIPWHQVVTGKTDDWLSWCQSHKRWLASEFLRRVDVGEPTVSFFSSWFDIQGRSETGYFLGCEAIKELERQFTLTEIALVDDAEAYFRPVLQQVIQKEGG